MILKPERETKSGGLVVPIGQISGEIGTVKVAKVIIIDLEEPQWHLRLEMMHTTGGNSRGIADEALLGNHR